MAMVFIGLSQIFIDGGFSAALIRRSENDDLTRSSVFIATVVIGAALALSFYLVAPLIAGFYDFVLLTGVVRWLALGVFINSFLVVQTAILTKELRFKELNIRLFAAGVVSGIVGITMAYNGYGVYALIGQYLTTSVVSVVALWTVADWRPSANFSMTKLLELNRFGRYVFFSNAINQFFLKMDALVIGKLFLPATLGYFTRANSLNLMTVRYTSGILAKVFYPVMGRLKEDKEEFRRVFLKTISLTSFLTFLVAGVLLFSAEIIILTLFGEKWLPSVVIFQILALKIFNYPINVIIIKSYLARGMSKKNFHYTLLRSVFRLLPVATALLYGFTAFLYAMVVTSVLATLFNNFVLSRDLNISFVKQVSGIYKYAVLFLFAGAIALLLQKSMNGGLFTDLLATFVYAVSYLFIAVVTNREIKFLLFQLTNKVKSSLNLA